MACSDPLRTQGSRDNLVTWLADAEMPSVKSLKSVRVKRVKQPSVSAVTPMNATRPTADSLENGAVSSQDSIDWAACRKSSRGFIGKKLACCANATS